MFGIIPDKDDYDQQQKLGIIRAQKAMSITVKNEPVAGNTRKKNVPFLEWIIISPTNNVCYATFKVFITCLCIFSSFYYAYFAAFRYDVDGYWCPSGTGTAE